MDIGTWLRSVQLPQYEQAFRENDISADILPELTAEDLVGLGVTSIGHRRTLLAAIAALRGDGLARGGTAEPRPAVPPSVEPTRAGAERRQLTVVFVDLVGSTALSSRLDPEDMSKLLRTYQNAVTGGFARFEGHVAKLMGDGVLAYFGWPKAHEDEAERAVRAGLAAVEAVGHLASPTGEPLAARVGIATGVVVVGDLIGEGAAQEEAVVGETPKSCRPSAGTRATQRSGDRRGYTTASGRVVRGEGSRGPAAQGINDPGSSVSCARTRSRGEPLRGASCQETGADRRA